MNEPLILVTNDDGIASAGLWAAVEALLPLGELLIVAPDRQWSGAGRAMPHHVSGALTRVEREILGQQVTAYAVDASPALAVGHGVLELASRRPMLVVSGINSGANLSTDVTISGTVGAALEGGAFGIPALAVSLEMAPQHYLTGDTGADYSAAIANTRRFAEFLLSGGLPQTPVLNVNIPAAATPETAWRYTRLSRTRYFTPLPPDRLAGKGRPQYRLITEPHQTEPDSDIYAILVDQVVSVTPLTLDLTAPSYVALAGSWHTAPEWLYEDPHPALGAQRLLYKTYAD